MLETTYWLLTATKLKLHRSRYPPPRVRCGPLCPRLSLLTGTALETKRLNLIQVVESVGEYINHEDATVRSKAVRYLSASFAALPKDFLSRQQLMVLTEFFCARMQDGGCLGALVHLQSLKRFNSEMAVITVKA